MSEEKKTVELNDDELDKVVGGVNEGCDTKIAKDIEICEAIISKYTLLLESPGISEEQKLEYKIKITKAQVELEQLMKSKRNADMFNL